MFRLGDRVRIVRHPEWPDGVTGTISTPAGVVVQLAGEDEWQRCRRVVQGRNRLIEFYWVRFDAPHDDGSGDGPYAGGEIDEQYLELIEREP